MKNEMKTERDLFKRKMNTAELCRLCLASDIKMHHIVNTEYQEMFEKLSTKLCTTDRRPETLCYICFSQLRRCCRFVDMSRRAEDILTKLSLNGFQCTQDNITELNLSMKQPLSVAPMKYLFSCDDIRESSHVIVKEEAISMKEEEKEDELLVETVHTHDSSCNKRSADEEEIKVTQENITELYLSMQPPLSVAPMPFTGNIHESSHVIVKEEAIAMKEEVTAEEVLTVEFVHTHDSSRDKRTAEEEKEIESEDLSPARCNIIRKCCKPEVNSDQDVNELPSTMDVEQPDLKTTYFCDFCSRTFTVKRKLVAHIKQLHTSQIPFKCNGDGKKLHSVKPMNIKIRAMQNACNECGKIFSFKSNLIRHMSVHTGEKPYACNVCAKKFKEKSHLTRHKRVHIGEKPYGCNVCNKKFKRIIHLKSHFRVHTGQKPYTCDICEKMFSCIWSFTRHKSVHTGERRYTCDICNKKFAYKSHLIRHIKVHTGEMPYDCYICNKKFKEKHHLTSHMCVHTGKKPFACDLCDKDFYRRACLATHVMSIHTGVKPFSCDTCGKKYGSKSGFRRHTKVHSVDTRLQ